MEGNHSHDHQLGFWRKYVFSQDHKVIGIQYGFTSLLFLLFGFTLMMVMRWQLAYPGQPIPIIGSWLGDDRAPQGIMLPEFYNQLGAMHGTIMVFLGIVPLAVGAFGNYVMPLQIGAPDMAFPKLNMMSYWVYFIGRRHDADELCDAGRRREFRMDIVSATFRHRDDRPNGVAHRHGFSYHLFTCSAQSTSSLRSSSFAQKDSRSCACRFLYGRSL